MKAVELWTDKFEDPQGSPIAVYDVIYTDEGSKVVVAAGADLLIYDAADGSIIKTIKAHKESIFCLAPLLGDGFASGGHDKQVIIWSNSYQGVLKYSHNDAIQSISQNPITGVVLTCTTSDFGLWTPDVKAVPKTKVQAKIICSSWSPDGQFFALGFFNGIVSIRSSSGEETARIARSNSPIWSLSWSPSLDLEANILAVTDWSQKLSYFQASGEQVGKDTVLKFDPCSVSYFGNGELMLLGGSNRQVNLWTADGLDMGTVCTRDGWIWSCKASPNENQVIVGSADGSVSAYQLNFEPVYGIFRDQYAYRQNLTEVVIHNLSTNHKAKLKCKDYIKQISVYGDLMAVQLLSKTCIYEQFADEEGLMHYKIKTKILKPLGTAQLLVASSHIIFYHSDKLESMAFSGENGQEWKFDSEVTFAKVFGGLKGKEGVVVGLRDGNVFKAFLDNPFPILLVQHKFPIQFVDINSEKTKLAVVDEENTCSVYEMITKALLYQEPAVKCVAWNAEITDSICFSSLKGELIVKIDNFTTYQQGYSGKVIGFNGAKAYCLAGNELKIIDIYHSALIDGFLERGDFGSAFRIACVGATEVEWRKLGICAMQKMALGVAKKAFIRIKDFKLLEAVTAIEKMKQEGRQENDLFMAQVAALSENYAEVLLHLRKAAKLFKRSGNSQRAVEMYTELNMWELATQFAEEGRAGTSEILLKKARLQAEKKDDVEAANTYEQLGELDEAIALLGNGGHAEKLMELARRLHHDNRKALLKCIDLLKRLGKNDYVLELLGKVGDLKLILAYYVDRQDWETAFKIGREHPELNEQIYLPYGNFLVSNDRFDEAQEYYTKAGRPDEAIKVLKFLAAGSIDQENFELAAYYYWCLSRSTLASSAVAPDKAIKDWKLFSELAVVYYAYSFVHQYISDPFTFSSPSTLMNSAKIVLQEMQKSKITLNGISKVNAYYCLAKVASQVGCLKLSQSCYDKLHSLRIPQTWQDTVDLATMLIKSKPAKNSEEYNQICGQCNFSNAVIGGSECSNCYEPYVYSFYSFEALPVVRFIPDKSIDEDEVAKLLKAESPGDISVEEFSRRVFGQVREGEEYSHIVFNRQDLLDCDSRRVFTKKWSSKLLPDEYYFLNSTEIYAVLCSSCNQFFAEEEWNYQILMEGRCPFCRCKGELSG